MENLGCSFGIDESRLEDEIDSFIENVEERLGHKINEPKPENIDYATIKNKFEKESNDNFYKFLDCYNKKLKKMFGDYIKEKHGLKGLTDDIQKELNSLYWWNIRQKSQLKKDMADIREYDKMIPERMEVLYYLKKAVEKLLPVYKPENGSTGGKTRRKKSKNNPKKSRNNRKKSNRRRR